jgi:hypothetical protein
MVKRGKYIVALFAISLTTIFSKKEKCSTLANVDFRLSTTKTILLGKKGSVCWTV